MGQECDYLGSVIACFHAQFWIEGVAVDAVRLNLPVRMGNTLLFSLAEF